VERQRWNGNGGTATVERQRWNGNGLTQRRKGEQKNGNSSNTALLPLLLQPMRAEVAADHHIARKCLDPADGLCAISSGSLLLRSSLFDLSVLEEDGKSCKAL